MKRSKEGRLKRERDWLKQYRQNRTFENDKRKFNLQKENARGHTCNWMQRKQQFGSKIWERKQRKRKV